MLKQAYFQEFGATCTRYARSLELEKRSWSSAKAIAANLESCITCKITLSALSFHLSIDKTLAPIH